MHRISPLVLATGPADAADPDRTLAPASRPLCLAGQVARAAGDAGLVRQRHGGWQAGPGQHPARAGPDSTLSLAMTVEGQVNTYILKNLDVAQECYEAALGREPQRLPCLAAQGHAYDAFKDEGKEAVRHTRHALKLSPLDPLKYYFDSLAATAALAAGHYRARAEPGAESPAAQPNACIDPARADHRALGARRHEEATKEARELSEDRPELQGIHLSRKIASSTVPARHNSVVHVIASAPGIPQ